MWIQTNNRGFTVVELLVVIIIIAILATVTVAGFNGVQQRAKAASTASQASKMHKYLRLYVTLNSASQLKSLLPLPGGGAPALFCLGTGYTDVVEGAPVGCYSNFGLQSAQSNSGLDTALQTMGSISAASYPRLTIESEGDLPLEQSAPVLVYPAPSTTLVDGRPNVFGYIRYTIPGANADCGNRPMLVYQGTDGGGNPLYSASNSAKNSSTGSASGGSYTVCDLYFHPDAV